MSIASMVYTVAVIEIDNFVLPVVGGEGAGDGRTDASAYPVTITPLGITEPRRTLIRKGSDALGGVLCAISQG